MIPQYKTALDYPSATGLMPMLLSIRDGIPFAFEGILFAAFLVLALGNYFLVKSKTGREKVLVALLSSSIVTMVLSIFLAMGTLVSFLTVLFWAFMSIVWYSVIKISDNY